MVGSCRSLSAGRRSGMGRTVQAHGPSADQRRCRSATLVNIVWFSDLHPSSDLDVFHPCPYRPKQGEQPEYEQEHDRKDHVGDLGRGATALLRG